MLALGWIAIPGAGAAPVPDIHVCNATGTFTRTTYDYGVVIWSMSADGTCTSSAGTVSVHISGRKDGYLASPSFDTPCGSASRATETPHPLVVQYTTSDGTVISPQFWEFTTTRAFEVWSMGFTPHAYPAQVIGAGSAANRIFLQCPGTPTARFDFSFAA